MNLTSIVHAAAGAIGIATMSVVAIPEALAQGPNSIQSSPVQAVTGSVQRITLIMGKGELLKTSVPFAKVSVTDDKFVEVTPQSDREFVLNPRGVGSTNVFVFDEKNGLIARLDVKVVGATVNTQQVREETYGELPGTVRIYGRIYDVQGALVKPAVYECNDRNCENVSEAPSAVPGPTETTKARPNGGAPTENENPQ